NPPQDKDVAKLGDNDKPAQARPEGAATAGGGAGARPSDASGPRANPAGPSDRQQSESLAERVGSSGLGGGGADLSDARNARHRGDATFSKRAGTLADQPAGSPKDGESTSKTGGLAQSGAKAGQGGVNGTLNSEDEIVKSKKLSG